MDEKQICEKMGLVAKLEVREYFTHYLEEIFPKQLAVAITAHNKDVTAHTDQIKVAVRTESLRLKLWIYTLIFGGGLGGGIGLARFIFGS